MRSFGCCFGVALFLALVALPVPGLAGLAVDFTATTNDLNNGWGYSMGWEFHVVAPFTVTQLGYYDDHKDGLAQAHHVGIWDPSGILLVSGTVQPGDPLVSWWRWTSVTPVVLMPNTGYVIAGVSGVVEHYTWGDATNPLQGFVTDPRIQFAADRSLVSATLVYPTYSQGGGLIGFFGPNFSGPGAGIPEPATSALIGGGLLALALAFRGRAQA